MDVRVARLEARTVYTNSYVAATFRLSPAVRQQFVGRVQDVLVVHIGNRVVTLLRVLWYREREWDPQLRLHRVRVGGASADALYEPDQLIEAKLVDSQVWLTDISGQPHWQSVHYKLKATHVVPDHLLPEPAA